MGAFYPLGTKEGQSKMVRQGQKVELYVWDMAQQKWNKVGDIVGATGGSQQTSGKTLFEGKVRSFNCITIFTR